MDINRELEEIIKRNARVEVDKAWETSWTRALTIAVFTYIIASAWLILINDSNPLLKACVPVVGFLLSTLSLPVVKRWWTKRINKIY